MPILCELFQRIRNVCFWTSYGVMSLLKNVFLLFWVFLSRLHRLNGQTSAERSPDLKAIFLGQMYHSVSGFISTQTGANLKDKMAQERMAMVFWFQETMKSTQVIRAILKYKIWKTTWWWIKVNWTYNTSTLGAYWDKHIIVVVTSLSKARCTHFIKSWHWIILIVTFTI